MHQLGLNLVIEVWFELGAIFFAIAPA